MKRLWAAIVVLIVPCLVSTNAGGEDDTEAALAELMQQVRNNSHVHQEDEVGSAEAFVPFLKRYVTDENWRVRWRALNIAAGVHSPDALAVLLIGLGGTDQNDRRYAAWIALRDYSPEELRPRAAEIAAAVMAHLGREERAHPLLLLIASGPQPPEIVKALQEYRTRVDPAATLPALDSAKRAPESFIVDLVLAEHGDPEALQRAADEIRGGKVGSAVFTAHAARLLTRDPLFAALTTRLTDQTDVEPAGPWGTGLFYRMCDLALHALATSGRVKPPFDVGTLRRFSDQELRDARDAAQMPTGRR